MDKEEIEHIIDKAYLLIQRYFGKGKKSYPKIKLHRDIYARLSGDEEQSGEHSGTSMAEYDETSNEIYIYYPNIKNEEDLLNQIIDSSEVHNNQNVKEAFKNYKVNKNSR